MTTVSGDMEVDETEVANDLYNTINRTVTLEKENNFQSIENIFKDSNAIGNYLCKLLLNTLNAINYSESSKYCQYTYTGFG